MRKIIFATLIAVACAAGLPAAAQEYQSGAYDARGMTGWTYDASLGAPIWFPHRQTNPPDGANCNLISTPANGTAAEYAQSYEQMTEAQLMGVMRMMGAPVVEILSIEPERVAKRPAMRSEFISDAGDFLVRQVSVEVAGTTSVVAVTCTARIDEFESRRAEFEAFESRVRWFPE